MSYDIILEHMHSIYLEQKSDNINMPNLDDEHLSPKDSTEQLNWSKPWNTQMDSLPNNSESSMKCKIRW